MTFNPRQTKNRFRSSNGNGSRRYRILYLATEDWYFWTHRLPLALAMRSAGFEVFVMTKCGKYAEEMRRLGLNVIPWGVSRIHLNPVRDLFASLQVARVYWRLRPTVVHHIALKPVVLGGLVAALFNIPAVNAVNGLGHTFSTDSRTMRALRVAILSLCRMVLKPRKSLAIFQNTADRNGFVERGIVAAEQAVIIRGAGVDLQVFRPAVRPTSPPTVLLAARMLWEKGVGEFVQAADKLQATGMRAKFVLAGRVDSEAAAAVPEMQLHEWTSSGVVEWVGHREDISQLLADATVVALPSYHEGMPKILLEAAACGRPIVATDCPGCRDVVDHGVNGFLVPPRDAPALANAIAVLLSNPELCQKMATASREKAEREFGVDGVVRLTMQVYSKLIGEDLYFRTLTAAAPKASCART
jgi:glycosyltransferase involved in cell wall biosynthesis